MGTMVHRIRILDCDQVIGALSEIRKEWELTGGDLVQTRASVGFLLADVARAILPAEDVYQALGDALYQQVNR